ncbi:MAG: hypothetical protein QGF55_05250, partial [SAR324 cluster bacterium]|nr:hypothetical protein [SAR324 cluster bacterium]
LSESKLILEQIGVPNILDYQPQIDEDELNCFFLEDPLEENDLSKEMRKDCNPFRIRLGRKDYQPSQFQTQP